MQVRCNCTLLVEDAGDGQCRVSLSGSLDISLPLIGGKAERIVMDAAVNHHKMLPHIWMRCGALSAPHRRPRVDNIDDCR